MVFTVMERLTMLGVLPQEGNFVTLKIVRRLREELSFSEEEVKMLNLREEGGKVFWNVANDPMKDVAVGEKATDIIVERLKELDKQNKLTEIHFSLYEKFVGE